MVDYRQHRLNEMGYDGVLIRYKVIDEWTRSSHYGTAIIKTGVPGFTEGKRIFVEEETNFRCPCGCPNNVIIVHQKPIRIDRWWK